MNLFAVLAVGEDQGLVGNRLILELHIRSILAYNLLRPLPQLAVSILLTRRITDTLEVVVAR